MAIIHQTVTRLMMDQSDSSENESLYLNGCFDSKSKNLSVNRFHSKQIPTSRPHRDRDRTTRKRTESHDYLNARDHVQVMPIGRQQYSSRSKRKSLPDQNHVDVSRVSTITPPMSPYTLQYRQRRKEKFSDANGHVHVDVVSPKQARNHGSSTKSSNSEDVLIELIDEDDLDEFDDANYTVVDVDEDDLSVVEYDSPPQHTVLQLVPRHQQTDKALQHRQQNIESPEYLSARRTVDVGRPKKKHKAATPVVELIDYRLVPRRVNVLVLEPESGASSPLSQRSIETSPSVYRLIPDESSVSPSSYPSSSPSSSAPSSSPPSSSAPSSSPETDMTNNIRNKTLSQSKINNTNVQVASVSFL